MCTSQSVSASDLMASQIQQQTLGFLQRYASNLSDDDDEDSLFGDNCSLEDVDTFDGEELMKINFSLHTSAVAVAVVDTNAEAEGADMSHADSLLSLSSITVLTNMGDFDLDKFIDDGTILDDSSEVPAMIVSDDSAFGSDVCIDVAAKSDSDQNDVETAEWRQMASLLEIPDSNMLQLGPSLETKTVDFAPVTVSPTSSIEEARRAHVAAMSASWKSARDLQAWDRKMGLRRCHCRTMMDTCMSRKRLLECVGIEVPDEEKEVKRQRRERQRARKHEKAKRHTSIDSLVATVVSNTSASASSRKASKKINTQSSRSPSNNVLKAAEELFLTSYTAISA